jgi:hypothetical protein
MATPNALILQQRNLLLAQQQSQQQSQQQLLGGGAMPEASIPGIDTGSPFKDPRRLAHKNKVASRFFPREISGSPALFALNPASAQTLIATAQSIKYRPHGSAIGSERLGNPDQSYILHAKVVLASNDFSYGVMLQSNGIRGRWYGPNDQRGLFYIPPKSTLSYPKGFDVLRPSRQFSSHVFKNFGHCTEQSFDAGVIGKIRDRYLIEHDPTSAIFQILYENQTNQKTGQTNYNLDEFRHGVDQSSGKALYLVPEPLYNSAKDCFKNKVIPNMPHTDFTAMTIGIQRLGKSWDAPFNVFHPGTMESADDIIASQHGTVSVTLWFNYRLIFPGNDD